MSWHKVTLNAQQIATGEQLRLLNEFSQLALAVAVGSGGQPKKKMAVFTSYRPEPAGNTALYHHYFSPGCLPEAEGIIKKYGGQPCEKPSNENLALLGSYGEDPWELVGGFQEPWYR
jgi:hypothetical protein